MHCTKTYLVRFRSLENGYVIENTCAKRIVFEEGYKTHVRLLFVVVFLVAGRHKTVENDFLGSFYFYIVFTICLIYHRHMSYIRYFFCCFFAFLRQHAAKNDICEQVNEIFQ